MKYRLGFSAATVLLSLACGSSKGPPPKATEESIDKDPPPRSHVLPPVIHDDDDTMGPAGGTAKETPPPAPQEDMKTVPAPTTIAPPQTPSKPNGKGALLTKPECDRIFGKLVDLTMAEQGVEPAQMKEAKAMMQSAAAADPAMAGFQKSCMTTLKKSNYTCAMSAKTSAALQSCIK